MLLYFDNYITDTPLFKYLYDDLAELRRKSKIYAAPSKMDVTLYTLSSYAIYPWSGVLIKYELEDDSKSSYFEKEVKKIFPKAVIVKGRSDSQKKYQEAVKMLKKMGDEWVFYAGNNDHPFVCPDLSLLEACLAKAKELYGKNKNVSIWYSHALEGAGLLSRSAAYGKSLSELVSDKEIIEENSDMFVCRNIRKGEFHSIQIVPIGLLEHWFFSKDMGGRKIRRSDDVAADVTTEGQLVIYPKGRICEHFDGYGNLNSRVGFSVDAMVPPLFYPTGFFEHDIKIAFGYPEYREGWVNINPSNPKYSFESKAGTDLKIGLNDLPLFWKGRISKIDINPKINQEEMEKLGNRNCRLLTYPWPSSTAQSIMLKYVSSPVWKVKKLVRRTQIYFEDPEFLEKTKNEGGAFFRLYKNSLSSIVGLVGKNKK